MTDIESTIPDLEQEKKTIERVLDKTRLVGHGPDEFEGLGNAGYVRIIESWQTVLLW